MGVSAWDPAQELRLFETLRSDLSKLSIKELFWFSLTIEMQCHSSTTYPCWTNKVHIESKSENIAEQINPLLLKMFSPTEYAKLALDKTIKNQIAEHC